VWCARVQTGDVGAALLVGVIGTSGRALPSTRRVARAALKGADASVAGLTGTVQLTQGDDDSLPVQLDISVTGLPIGSYAMHIHQYGDISSAFPMVNGITGGHYNPFAVQHGCWPNPIRHAGDILYSFNVTQNVTATQLSLQRDLIQLGGDSVASVIGRSFLIHAAPIDNCQAGTGIAYTGAAGTRIAQGVIGLVAAPGNVARSSGAVNFTSAAATLQATSAQVDQAATGSVLFGAADAHGFTRIVGSFSGLPVSSTLSLLIHTWGDLSSADGSAIGPHFDASNATHDVYPQARHTGDVLASLVTDATGAARFDISRDLLSLSAAQGNILGRAVAVHANADVGALSQPVSTQQRQQQQQQRNSGSSATAAAAHCGVCSVLLLVC
jgi:Cu-Zn family superoxide dismutase